MEAGSRIAASSHRRAPAPLGDTDTHDPLQGVCLSHPHSLEEDEEEEEEERKHHAGERAGWEDAIAVMARSAAVIPELPTESSLRVCASTASMKVKNVKKLSLTKGHFPRLAECAHFHYENVDFGSVQLSLAEDQNDVTRGALDPKELVYLIQICCQGRKWMVRRSYEDFRILDKHLHLCIYDRRFSQLTELPRFDNLRDKSQPLIQMLTAYLSRLSAIADNKINCGPALTWMEIDNKGNHLLVHEESSINVPAVAAAHVIKRYIAQAADELSFEVGDIVSVIDMPPKEDTGWWRGKHGFQVGFFPCDCVEIISEKVPPNMTSSLPKPVSKKHGKLITFLRTFMKSRPTKQKLKQRGILRERVFGCDLGEHLLNSGHDVPQVIRSCAEFIEKHGVVDGIYRLSGIASNIQKLRHEFDSEHIPDLTKDTYIQDIHSVGSLCKLYFRELPNPLLTYQLYDKFSDAVSAATDDERLVKIHDVIQQLPPPHYRTLEFLMRHLARMATFSYVTNMHCKNLAIVWAPNLLRSKQIESACFSGTSAFMEVRIQSVVVEFILNHVDVLFSPKLNTLIRESAGHTTLSRPKSLLVYSPSAKLLSLEEAQARTQAQLASPVSPDGKYIEVGEGPAALQGKFHTIIEFPTERKKAQNKMKKSPVASWRSFFNMGKSSTTAKRKMHHHPSGSGDAGTLRSAKSEESLTAHNPEGGPGVYRSRRPRSTSDALSTSFQNDPMSSRIQRDSQSSRKDGKKTPVASTSCVPALISPPHSADAGFVVPCENFDPMGFQCSAPLTEHDMPSGRKRSSRRKNGGSSSESEPLNKVISSALPTDALVTENANRHSNSGIFVSPVTAEVELEVSGELASGKMGLTATPAEPESHLIKPSESGAGDGCQPRPSSSSIQQAEGEVLNDTHSEQAQTMMQADSGTVTFDCTPGLVRSVSLITPQPAVKSAARMLALALAESAQQATQSKKRGSSEPPTPHSPVQLQDPLSMLQWPLLPSFQPPTSARGDHRGKALAGPSSTISTGSHTDAGSLQSTCACHGSESGLSCSDAGDANHSTNLPRHDTPATKGSDPKQTTESQAATRDNVRHIGVGTDGVGPGQSFEMEQHSSIKPLLSTDGLSATASLLSKQAVNASNFRSILAEASMPASVNDVLPHTPVTANNLSYQYSPKEESMLTSSRHIYPQQSLSPVGQSTPYFQPDYMRHQANVVSRDHYSTLAPRSFHQSIKYKGQNREEYSPSRLYRHSGPRYPPMDGASVYPTIRRVRSMHAPPEDKFFFIQHPASKQRPPVPSDIHQVRPYFEDGKVQYRYSPYAEARYSNADQYRLGSQGYSHSYTLRRLPPHPGRVMSSMENYRTPCVNLPFSREGSFVKQDVGPSSRRKDTAVYEVWGPAFSDQHVGQSIRQDNTGKKRLFDPVVPQPHSHNGSRRFQDTMHTRSKSDSGKDLLISTEGADGKYRVTMVSHYSPEHPLSEPDVPHPTPAGNNGAKATLMLKQSRSMFNYLHYASEAQPPPRKLTLHKEYSCPDFKHTSSPEGGSARLYSQDELLFKTLRGFPKEDRQYTLAKNHNLQRSERSQSVKSRVHPSHTKMAVERDHRLSYPVQSRMRTRSMFVPSRSNYVESYVSVQTKVPISHRMGTAVFPNYGCMPAHNKTLYPTTLGQGGFLRSELRPETQIYAE